MYNGRLKELQTYLKMHRSISATLRDKIKLYVDYKYNGHLFNEDAIMETINEQIRQEINMFSCKKLVTNVPLFKDMPLAFINTIIFSLTKVLYMPGEASLFSVFLFCFIVTTMLYPSRKVGKVRICVFRKMDLKVYNFGSY